MMRLVLFLLALTLPPAAAFAGHTRASMSYGGVERIYGLYTPQDVSRSRPAPRVIVLQGGGGSSREVIYSTRGRFDELAERDGFLVLYPDAVGRIWDTGGGEISNSLRSRQDDDGFIRAAIEEVSREHKVDPGRVFVTGVSRGGMEAYALACAHPDLFRRGLFGRIRPRRCLFR